MTSVLDDILRVLDVQPAPLDEAAQAANATALFVGGNVHNGHVFGGQVIGQAITAGGRTVDATRRLHSLHAYFLAPGDWQQPIQFHVIALRDGASFSQRRVQAVQPHGVILTMVGSWHIDEPGFAHQEAAPEVAGPQGLVPDRQRYQELARSRPELAGFATRFEAFDARQVEGILMTNQEPRSPLRHTWVKTARGIGDDSRLHEAVLGYLSDLDFMSTSMLPHGAMTADRGRVQATSLDHALWLHKPLRVDDWLLFRKESPRAVGARGFVRGSLFDTRGELVASVAQECLVRPREGLLGTTA